MTVTLTVFVPTGNADPLGGTLKIELTPQLSFVLILKLTTLEQTPGLVASKILDGQVMTGASVSATVMVKEQVDVFP